jgi:catechol 2,3-dioxygenase-like lactoylglutathione lyase family enzyme
VSEDTPAIDFENLPTPTEGFLVTHFITVRKVARSRAFYSEVLGGEVVLEENPCMVKLSNSWVIMNPGGPPTPDKPDISVVEYEPRNSVSTFMNLRVADIQACYEEWSSKGAEFVTPPIDRGAEIRCYMRDPDGYLIESRPVHRNPRRGTRQEAARGSARLRRYSSRCGTSPSRIQSGIAVFMPGSRSTSPFGSTSTWRRAPSTSRSSSRRIR